jgi:hypothetical protein
MKLSYMGLIVYLKKSYSLKKFIKKFLFIYMNIKLKLSYYWWISSEVNSLPGELILN